MMHIKFNRFDSIKRTQNQQVTVRHCLGSTSPFKTADRRVHSDPIFNIKLLSTEELPTSKAGEGSATDMVALVPRSSIFLSDLSEMSDNVSGSLAPWKILHCFVRPSFNLSTVDDAFFQGTLPFFYSSLISNMGPFVNYMPSFLSLPSARANFFFLEGHIILFFVADNIYIPGNFTMSYITLLFRHDTFFDSKLNTIFCSNHFTFFDSKLDTIFPSNYFTATCLVGFVPVLISL